MRRQPRVSGDNGGMADFLIITGLSGAGRSQAGATFEDLGWFVIDNMPTPLITKVAELVTASETADGIAGAARADGPAGADTDAGAAERVALVVGRRAGQLSELTGAVAELRATTGGRVKLLFLEASDEVLVRRYEGTRRRHPLNAAEGLTDSIALERALLQPIRESADVIIDTTDLNVHQLRRRLIEMFTPTAETMQIQVVSFGFKHGVPLDVDTVFDCRFLPNPHWVDELRPLTGLDEAVRRFVLDQPDDQRVRQPGRPPPRPGAARLREGGQVVPDHRRRVHRGPPPLGGAGRGAGPAHRPVRLRAAGAPP